MSDELPNGWAVAPLSTIATSRMGKTIIGHELSAEGIPVYSAGRDSGPWGHIATSDVVFPRGTLVVSARGTIGFVRLPDDDGFVSTQTTIAVRPTAALLPEFLRYALLGVDWSQITSATTIPMLTIRQLDAVRVLVPPASEQRRIVAKLDALLARSKKAREHLDRIPALLDALKRSILAAAFRGDLTADWRKANPDVEPATKLLERIRAERRRRWEEELRAKGKDPKKAKYEAPAPVDESELPELPEGWCWASLDELCPVFVDCAHRTPKYSSEGFPALRPRDVVGGILRLETAARVPASEFELQTERRRPRPGDVIYSRELSLGWGCVVPEGSQVCMSQGMCLFRPSDELSLSYFVHALNGGVARERAEATAVGSAHPHLNLSEIRRLPFPIAPLGEQRLIAAEVDRFATVLRQMSSQMLAMTAAVTSLEGATLASAFRGDLVPQNPNDEPADVMLARLRAATPAPAAKAPRAAPRAKRPASAPPEPASSMGDALDVVVGALVAAKRMTAEQVRTATGLGKDDVTPVLRGLVAAGKVRVEGKARGTAYVWAG